MGSRSFAPKKEKLPILAEPVSLPIIVEAAAGDGQEPPQGIAEAAMTGQDLVAEEAISALQALIRVDQESAREKDKNFKQEKNKEAEKNGSDSVNTSKQFGRYELVWTVNRDALSVSYAARSGALSDLLCLRIFNEKINESSQVRNIQKAARQAAELTHPNSASVYENGIGPSDAGEYAGAPYVVSEWIEGESLTELFKRTKRLDIAAFLNIFDQVGDVLIEAHSHMLVHGNLSPQKVIIVSHSGNNLLESELVKVIDFGMPVDPVQNAFYLAPEQSLDLERSDARCDIYALGCLMYESLVGRPPALGSQSVQSAVDYLHELSNQYSKDSKEYNALRLLDCIITRCLQKNPGKRFTDVRELKSALALVSECLTNVNGRRLPRRAEKLLLFRFLDLFDKKITAALTAYLLLGLFATKYIGEMQLQKLIDEAQMARFVDWPQAQANYVAAIKQAEAIGKPPSLQAELHWELGDAYKQQGLEAVNSDNKNDLFQDAIVQYNLAFQYFSHGPHFRSYALTLLENSSQLLANMDDGSRNVARRSAVLKKVQDLFAAKKYWPCIATARAFHTVEYDKQICQYAASAYYALAAKAPAQTAYKYVARAQYYNTYSEDADQQNNDVEELNASLIKAGFAQEGLATTRINLGLKALLHGDLDESFRLLQSDLGEPIPRLENSLVYYEDAQRRLHTRPANDPNCLKAIDPLCQELAIAEKAYGQHGKPLAPILSRLAAWFIAMSVQRKKQFSSTNV